MSKKNIVLIDHEPYSTRRRKLFYIDELISAGYNVAVWDVSQFVFPGMKVTDEITENYLEKLYTLEDLEKSLNKTNIDDTIFFVECINNWKTRKVFALLSEYKCVTIRMDMYANTTIKETLSQKLKRFLSGSFFKIIRGKIFLIARKIYNKRHHIQFPCYYLSSSAIVNRTHAINHPDYELYKFQPHPSVVKGEYIVFLDTYFPYHPDLKHFYQFDSNNIIACAKKYHDSLNNFFSFLERKYKMPIIIAAHPKSEYTGKEFGGREIIKYQTNNLVTNASLVVMQTSNSISYVALANKPIVFILTDASNQIPRYKYATQTLAQLFDKDVYNIDRMKNNFSKIDCSPLDEKKRQSYIYTYLTSKETENSKNIDIIISFLKQI